MPDQVAPLHQSHCGWNPKSWLTCGKEGAKIAADVTGVTDAWNCATQLDVEACLWTLANVAGYAAGPLGEGAVRALRAGRAAKDAEEAIRLGSGVGREGSSLSDAVHARANELTTPGSPDYQSVGRRGPVLSGVQDNLSGDIRIHQNHGTIPGNLHPSIAERLSTMGPGAAYKGVPGSHGEIYGLNDLLWAREAAGLSTAIDDSFSYYSVRLRGAGQGSMIPRCWNCFYLTNG
jgi:hypothetical protein